MFRVRLTAGRIALNDETEVRILYPKPIFLIWVFRRWLYGLVLETSVRRFESCYPDLFFCKGVPQTAIWACSGSMCSWVQISPPLPYFQVDLRRRSLIGKGAGLRNQLLRVRVSPSVLSFRVGDVIDSIEVLQTSCKGLNPFRSTISISDLGFLGTILLAAGFEPSLTKFWTSSVYRFRHTSLKNPKSKI